MEIKGNFVTVLSTGMEKRGWASLSIKMSQYVSSREHTCLLSAPSCPC